MTICVQAKAFILHFEEQLTFYQSQLVINLLDQKGDPLFSLPSRRSPLHHRLPHVSLFSRSVRWFAHERAASAGAEMELSEAYAGYLRHINSPKIK